MSDDPGGRIARRDELLELLYWLAGEGFTDVATPAAMTRFLGRSEHEVRETLDELVRRGDVAVDDGGEYVLTTVGRGEAARRFAEEFAPLLGHDRDECNDPLCACHTDPVAATDCRTARAQAGGGHRS